MEAQNTPFETVNTCPNCDHKTDVVKLGFEPAREICGRLNCTWGGVTLE